MLFNTTGINIVSNVAVQATNWAWHMHLDYLGKPRFMEWQRLCPWPPFRHDLGHAEVYHNLVPFAIFPTLPSYTIE